MKRKKFLRYILRSIILVCFAASVFYFVSVVGIDKINAYFSSFTFSDEFKDEQPFSDYNFNRLNETEKKAYISIFESIQNHPKYIKIPKLTKDEFNNVYFAVKNDNPQLLCFSDSCNMISFLSASFLEMSYDYSVDDCEHMSELLIEKARSVIATVPDSYDNFDTELYIHDYIIKECSYEDTDNSSNAYGCLIENYAVCSGYSRAAMLLLNMAGIKAVLIGGTGISETQGQVSHMWNIVWLDCEPYHLDLTWNDSGGNEEVSHLYFNLTDDEISVDHTDYSIDFICSATKYNYFSYYGLCFDDYTKAELEKIKKSLVDNINNGINFLEIRFADADAYNRASDAVVDSVTLNSDIYNIISYVSENTNGMIDDSHVNFSCDDDKYYIKLMFDWK